MAKTIVGAALEVLKSNQDTMSIQEIYNEIIKRSLYVFHAQDPISVLRVEIRRHSVGIDFPTASSRKYFRYDESNGRFSVLHKPAPKQSSAKKELSFPLDNVRKLYDEYLVTFKKSILDQLKKMNPYEFEKFCMKLLCTYGFNNVAVTQKSRDGGIDGYGKLKIGLAYMNVAFQCKRWNETIIGRKELDAFRGAIQGEYEQGLYFTTSSFSREATKFSIKKGAVPIILIEGKMIVDFMIDKQFGIEHEDLPIYINAIDNIFS